MKIINVKKNDTTYFKAHFKTINNKGNKDYQNKIKMRQATKNRQKRHIMGILKRKG